LEGFFYVGVAISLAAQGNKKGILAWQKEACIPGDMGDRELSGRRSYLAIKQRGEFLRGPRAP
jgi:hypothetical protein